MSSFDLGAFDPPLTVPVLQSGPVLLRPFELSDLDLVRQAAPDSYITAITTVPVHYSDDEGRGFIERQHERASGGHGFSFVIAESAEPAVGLGSIGLWLREIESGRASIGYWLIPGARGRKLAGWALRGVVAFAFGQLSIPRLHLFVEPWNAASACTAEAAGFTREALLRGWERVGGEQRDAFCYVLLHREWSAGE
ncbi:MAG TPA: GNAT family N-acetyltransferase [Acidimicrobiales bacterium]|nr:GNAT family N-acetyltransferase [Acidimicrobiales bacterium]